MNIVSCEVLVKSIPWNHALLNTLWFRLLSAEWRRCSRKSALERKRNNWSRFLQTLRENLKGVPFQSSTCHRYSQIGVGMGPTTLSVGSMPTSQAKLRGSRTASTKIRRRPAKPATRRKKHDCHDCLLPEGSWGRFFFIKPRCFHWLLLPFSKEDTGCGSLPCPKSGEIFGAATFGSSCGELPGSETQELLVHMQCLMFLTGTKNQTEWKMFVCKYVIPVVLHKAVAEVSKIGNL